MFINQMSAIIRSKIPLITITVILLLIGGIYLVFLLTPSPPETRFEEARMSISDAKKTGADIYSSQYFLKAENLYDSALILWKNENRKFILFRSYAQIDTCINHIIKYAEKAKVESLHNVRNIQAIVANEIEHQQRSILKHENLIKSLPKNKTANLSFEKGKLMLAEARFDFERKNYQNARQKLQQSAQNLNHSISQLKEVLIDYFKSHSDWTEWNRQTIELSKKTGKTAIVVDKMARKCYLYKKGKLKESFSAELGLNWIGDKQMKGDKSTPEGMYLVTKKLDSKKTKYYKALMINYPNEDDQTRFKENLKNGNIPKGSQIGGLIEIHGEGGKGVDWTDGCVALINSDMDVVFRMAEIGTPVTIVGSLAGLSEILKN
ncbi:MAG: L,D-transpeptidase family protein [Bacteroidales bacterium]|nr:L,D-transpeptidase family protein [Bacteroidales bacterium]